MSVDGPLFHKYNLSRTDGKPMGDAFVLELKDPYAADALVAYADACEVTHPELAESMREQYGIRRAAKDETMRTMRDQVRDTCTRAEKAEAERNRLRDALSAALEWAGPMGEAPVKARPEWFDKARNALAATPTPATGSGGEASNAAYDRARELMDTIAMGVAGARARNTTDLCVGLIHAGNAVGELRGVVAELYKAHPAPAGGDAGES